MIQFADGSLDPRRWSVFQNLACLASIGSTNDLSREVIDVYFREEQALPATVFLAEEQPGAGGPRGGAGAAAPGRRQKPPRGRARAGGGAPGGARGRRRRAAEST